MEYPYGIERDHWLRQMPNAAVDNLTELARHDPLMAYEIMTTSFRVKCHLALTHLIKCRMDHNGNVSDFCLEYLHCAIYGAERVSSCTILINDERASQNILTIDQNGNKFGGYSRPKISGLLFLIKDRTLIRTPDVTKRYKMDLLENAISTYRDLIHFP